MLLRLTFDHSALRDEAKERGYEKQGFTESEDVEVPGYQAKGPYSKEPWAISGLTKFIYCSEMLYVELAFIEDKTKTLILYHDCQDYPDSPVKVPIQAIQPQEKILSISGEKPLDEKDHK